MPKNNIKQKRRVSRKKILIFLLIFFTVLFIIKLFNTNITNIYISGNNYLTDQEIIDIASLSDYPNTMNNLSFNIEKKLKKNKYINKVSVKKNILLNKVYIEIEENYPLFYYSTKNKTILYNGEEIDGSESLTIVTNSIPSDVYMKLIEKTKKIDINILNRISEIEYSPNEVLKERFLLLMNDGNYVYIILDKFSALNKYLDIIKKFDDKKGVLYLDSGEYFDVFD